MMQDILAWGVFGACVLTGMMGLIAAALATSSDGDGGVGGDEKDELHGGASDE